MRVPGRGHVDGELSHGVTAASLRASSVPPLGSVAWVQVTAAPSGLASLSLDLEPTRTQTRAASAPRALPGLDVKLSKAAPPGVALSTLGVRWTGQWGHTVVGVLSGEHGKGMV